MLWHKGTEHPKPNKTVLIYDVKGYVHLGDWTEETVEETELPFFPGLTISTRINARWFFSGAECGKDHYDDEVFAWCELPEPPGLPNLPDWKEEE